MTTKSAQSAKPKRGQSLRFRMLVGSLIWIVVSVAVAGWALQQLFAQHASQQFRNELNLHLNQLTGAFSLEDGTPALVVALSDPRLEQPLSGLYWQVDSLDAAGNIQQAGVLRSRSLWDQVLPAGPEPEDGKRDMLYTYDSPTLKTLEVLSRRITLSDEDEAHQYWRLVVAADQENLNEPLAHFTTMLSVALGALALGMGVASVALIAGGMRPLGRLRQKLALVRKGTASQLEGEFPNEVQPLVDEFNAVLTTNTDIVQRARTQAGNLAHAIKTPLSILENAAYNDSGQLGALVSEQVSIARRQIDYHLARARAAAAMQASGLFTPVEPAVSALVRTMQRLYVGRQLTIQAQVNPVGLSFKGEEQDLHEMLGNLLDNACKWARAQVQVTAYAEGPWVVFSVEDDGPGLSAEESIAAFKRGVRLDNQIPGSGLGLHIVAEMAELYQGSIQAERSELGGLKMALRLPGVV
ncbi:sensor histidine kinase [Paenalcaligenes sp. Me52]|uniref:sensor histidine kinase n=1 Tax=Paenalcaligenes sp. Me52 TaxID=3392038 RepID=UPI003D2822C3